jgi:hypothetical protein
MIEMILTTKAGFPFFNRPGRRQAARFVVPIMPTECAVC